MGRVLGHWIDNGSFAAAEGETLLPVTSPGTGDALAQVPLGSKETVERAVASSQTAFELWR
jgi:acyl-CoA reductase-like NAD-dependent aldehyde dehydrogenase